MTIDAFSLVCNILTVIDLSDTFYDMNREIYGNSKPDSAVGDSANELSECARGLPSRLRAPKRLTILTSD